MNFDEYMGILISRWLKQKCTVLGKPTGRKWPIKNFQVGKEPEQKKNK